MADESSAAGPSEVVSATPTKVANGKILLSVKDPNGNVITLDVDTWENHIVVRHPEMKDRLDAVKVTLERPELIQRRGNTSTCFYYRLTGKKFHKYDDVYIGVVVHLPGGESKGRVRTAHVLREIRKGPGEILWLKQQN